jgi:hypothetical protein
VAERSFAGISRNPAGTANLGGDSVGFTGSHDACEVNSKQVRVWQLEVQVVDSLGESSAVDVGVELYVGADVSTVEDA